MKPTCESCKYCVKGVNQHWTCHRYPPHWETVYANDWCGEFRSNKIELSEEIMQEITNNAGKIAEISITEKANQPEEKPTSDKVKEFLKSFLPDGKKDK